MEGLKKHELAEADYMSGMKYKQLADKYNVSVNTVKSWKQRYGWDRKRKTGVHTNAGMRAQKKKGCIHGLQKKWQGMGV